jgi:hypothetical protein
VSVSVFVFGRAIEPAGMVEEVAVIIQRCFDGRQALR